MSSNEINALITLIEDPDPGIFSHVKQELVARGEEVIPQLEKYWELNHYGELFQERIEALIHSIQYDSVVQQLKAWKDEEDPDLLEGVLLINKYQYPSFDDSEIRRQIGKIRQDVWLELNDNLTALEIVNIFNHIIYNVHNFDGNKNNYSSPQNSFIADVLTSRKGNPLSLGILYRILAHSLEIPIFGVNLPNHFILSWVDDSPLAAALDDGTGESRILFYINPFTGGTVIHRSEVDEFLNYLNLPNNVSYYQPCTNVDIISRMINNLMYSYAQMGKEDKVEELKSLQAIFTATATT
jgi:regulator of sirC expression with transglutaminase-like and TPR domain